MSERSPRLRALRPRPSLITKSTEKSQSSIESDAEGNTSQKNKSEPENADGTRDDSDSEPRLVIKEEPEDNTADEKIEADRKYVCNSCKPLHEFSSLIDYLQHLKARHQQKTKNHQCYYCSYSYQNPKKLQRHIITAHKDVQGEKSGEIVRRNKCTMCNFVAYTPTDMENHQRLHHLKRRFFRCTKCSYMTHVRARYTKHVKYHSMPMIKCDDCDFRTPYKWNLDRHTRNHGGGGAFQCRACNFTAEIRQSLTVHETNHHEPPIGHITKKMTSPFERKPRNSPKRYNQVGASDYRDVPNLEKESNSRSSENPLDEEDGKSAIDGADCIALRCEEKGCQFITAWDSEMQRHVAESHGGSQTPSKKKPLPMLIPLSPGSKSASANSNTTPSSSPTTVLNVPRVRVRPELAKIARDTEIAKLYNNREGAIKKEVSPPSTFERRNATFFDKLKERLMTTTGNAGINNQVAVSNVNDLKCWCTFEASSPDELSSHKKTHHTALSVSLGVSRCPKCRRRCKTSSDLQIHMKICPAYNDNRDNSQENTVNSDNYATTPSSNDFELPLQVDWDGSHSGFISSGSSMDGVSPNPTSRRVFKCPHCPFWASTASRFHVHIVGHLNRKPFECSLCAYRSNWRWDITKHIKLKAARDAAHLNARVLMTDETGRRNYSKYNKYLTQMKHQGPENASIEENQGLLRTGEPPRKVLIMTDGKSYPEVLERPAKCIDALSSDSNSSQAVKTSNLQTTKTPGQSLLKIIPSTSTPNNTDPSAISPQSAPSEETKRTMWKCKRCNYRDSNKDILLLHVKSHYESLGKPSKESNKLICKDCPFIANDPESLAIHKVHHRPNLEAIFKCYLCPYYVSTKTELLEHARLHGEELAVVHQSEASRKTKSPINVTPQTSPDKKNISLGTMGHISPSSSIFNAAASQDIQAPPLLLDTRALPDTPMVWVSRPDSTFAKMLKCRHCPYVSSRRAEVKDHEIMHMNTNQFANSLVCPDCSFVCIQSEVMEAHANMHRGSLGTVHCLVADNRSDAQQLDDLKSILGLPKTPTLGPEPDLRDSRLVHSCNKCPARFLCEKELRIHLRYHSTSLAYTCEWCSYAARQSAHLLAHQKAHSSEYQERTRYLSSLYGNSQRYPPPLTACIETRSRVDDTNENQCAWIVVEVANREQNHQNGEPQENQVFTCVKCPARYFKLDALEYHMTLHGSNNRFKCEECDYSSKTAQNLMKHQVVHRRHAETPDQMVYRVPPPNPEIITVANGTEGRDFAYPGYVRNDNIKERKYKCHKCPSAFEKREQYRIHLPLHGSKQKYRCNQCDYAVKCYDTCVQHLRDHVVDGELQARTRQPKVDCENDVDEIEKSDTVKTRRKSTISSGSIVNNIMSGSSVRNGRFKEKKYKCHKCPSVIEKREQYRIHLSLHGSKQKYRCNQCDYAVKCYDTCVQHLKDHIVNGGAETCARQLEIDDCLGHENDIYEVEKSNSVKTRRKSTISPGSVVNNLMSGSLGDGISAISNQDKQTMMLMQRKASSTSNEINDNGLRCSECPFSTADQITLDNHKRRHGIDRLTPPCPHCNYVPRKDENAGEHIRLHFTRMYKPDGYLIIEKLALKMEKLDGNKNDKNKENELLFRECSDGKFIPLSDISTLPMSNKKGKSVKEKIIIDPTTGEATHRVKD